MRAWLPAVSPRRAVALTLIHGRSHPRLLVRFRLDLLVPGGGSNPAARGQGQGAGALSAFFARPDLQGAGLGYLAVQSLGAQGPLQWRDMERLAGELSLP